MKRGLFGGTFDPPHVGHLMMAEVARESLGLERVDFIPTNISPHKEGQLVQPAAFRVRMVQAAVKEFPHFFVSTIELAREGISYTIDTVREIADHSVGDDLYWLLGADMLQDLPHWKEVEAILSYVTIVAAPRPGVNLQAIADDLKSLYENARIVILAMPELDISSTWLRDRMQKGLRVDPLLPFGVSRLIVQERGYVL